MNDQNLYGRNPEKLDGLLHMVHTFFDDIQMKFNCKCAVAHFVNGKLSGHNAGVMVGKTETIKGLGPGHVYKYLGVDESNGIQHRTMRERLRQEYFHRVKMVLRTKLYGRFYSHQWSWQYTQTPLIRAAWDRALPVTRPSQSLVPSSVWCQVSLLTSSAFVVETTSFVWRQTSHHVDHAWNAWRDYAMLRVPGRRMCPDMGRPDKGSLSVLSYSEDVLWTKLYGQNKVLAINEIDERGSSLPCKVSTILQQTHKGGTHKLAKNPSVCNNLGMEWGWV